MRNFLFIFIVFINLASCAEIPEIPNLSADSLRQIPPKHRAIIAEIAADHRDYCYFKLGKNFAELGDEAFGEGFVVGKNSLETIQISYWRRASVLYQNFRCDGSNDWRATSRRARPLAHRHAVFVHSRRSTGRRGGAVRSSAR